MKIVSFYSYKGGVGRSLSLVNVAYQLSQRGQRIGLIDLDVEAGGLNHILQQDVRDDRDLLSLLVPTNRDLTSLEEYVKAISFRKDEQARVFLLPTVTDSVLLDEIKWNEGTQRFLSDDLFPLFSKIYELDYIFLDSRSGLSEFSALALKAADMEVLVCRLDKQNRYGIRHIVDICSAASKPFKIVASAVPAQGRKKYLKIFEDEVGAKIDYVLPYVADLYYEETIISRQSPLHPLAKKYALLATNIHSELHENP